MLDTDAYNEQCSRDPEPHQWHCLCSYQVLTQFDTQQLFSTINSHAVHVDPSTN